MLFVDGGNDRVGIGTSSPLTNLHIGSGTEGSYLGLLINRGATTNFLVACDGTKQAYIGTDSSNAHIKLGSLSNHPVQISQNNGNAIYIDTSKRVGIGVNDPDCKLEIGGTDAMSVPSGTTAQRPTARNGMMRYNTTEDQMECREDDNWKYIDTTIPTYDVEYLVVAGGGGSSCYFSGAGGAGGYRTATGFALTPGTDYTVTVGAGGTGGLGTNVGGNGENSVFSTITSTGGGRGGVHASYSGASGGSGGGAALAGYSAGGAGTAGQGNDGGEGTWGSGVEATGGGGGAGAAGGDASTSGPVGGAGGIGSSSSITGSAVYYAGGGGGAAQDGGTGGSGGNGGGGDGGVDDVVGSDGTVNTGGGAGAGSVDPQQHSVRGASGGSGVVILRIPTANYSGTTTGSPTVTTDGDYKVVKFTGSGTYTA